MKRSAERGAGSQIDMDTIETSNLNRQFLFRRRHVGESKAKVAAEAVKRFRPAANIVSHQVCALRPSAPCGWRQHVAQAHSAWTPSAQPGAVAVISALPLLAAPRQF